MAKLWKVVQDCRKQIRQEILSNVVPAGKGAKFKPHNTGAIPLQNSAQETRLFDVVSSGDPTTTNAWGTSADDHYVMIYIVIGYTNDLNFNEYAQSDYDAIQYRLHNIDVSAVTGLNFYRVNDFKWEGTDDFRYMVISVETLITATQT